MSNDYIIGLKSVECPICHKSFIPAVYHMYKIKTAYYCSWTCYRKAGGGNGKKIYSRKTKAEKRNKIL
jgi:hypothetical protein